MSEYPADTIAEQAEELERRKKLLNVALDRNEYLRSLLAGQAKAITELLDTYDAMKNIETSVFVSLRARNATILKELEKDASRSEIQPKQD